MNPTPNGDVTVIDGVPHLRLTRTFNAPIADVWASVTEPERLDRWIGTWSGAPGTGNTIQFVMTAEDSAEPEDVHILQCDAPNRFMGDFSQGGSVWKMGFTLEETAGTTTLTFTQAMRNADGTDTFGAESYGPGWEYYLDRLVAIRTGSGDPDWDDYYPAMSDYYRDLAAAHTEESPTEELPPLT